MAEAKPPAGGGPWGLDSRDRWVAPPVAEPPSGTPDLSHLPPPPGPGQPGAGWSPSPAAEAPTTDAGGSARRGGSCPTSSFSLRQLATFLACVVAVTWFAPRIFATAGVGSSPTGFAGGTVGMLVLGVTFVLANAVRRGLGRRASRLPANAQDVVWIVAVLGIAAGITWALGRSEAGVPDGVLIVMLALLVVLPLGAALAKRRR